VVVALDLERHGQPVAEIEDACVLAWPLQHTAALARQTLEEERGVLVTTMLRPEQREDGQLEVVRLAARQVADTVELPVREAEQAMEGLFGDRTQSRPV
jgi:hypothetical protein